MVSSTKWGRGCQVRVIDGHRWGVNDKGRGEYPPPWSNNRTKRGSVVRQGRSICTYRYTPLIGRFHFNQNYSNVRAPPPGWSLLWGGGGHSRGDYGKIKLFIMVYYGDNYNLLRIFRTFIMEITVFSQGTFVYSEKTLPSRA